ncbi:DUF1150 family protein [Rhodobacterales bacterium HKCCE4037]|nr:DUF1150 family protein [Rhodobacterales bacterium HKCCE4037]
MTEDQINHGEAPRGARPIVYIRKVAVADLPDEVQVQAQGMKNLYAIGGENGEQIALVRDRDLAFIVARQNDLNPVSVH